MDHLLRISDFAYLSGITRKNLIYYDEIDLLKPERVLDNGYRFYSYHQLETVSVIEVLREVGMPLGDIKRHLGERTPDALLALFTAQRMNLDAKIRRLQLIQSMIDIRLATTHRAMEIDPTTLEVQTCGEELLFTGEKIAGQNSPEELETALNLFYELCAKKKMIYGYSCGTIISREDLLGGNWRIPSYYFFEISKKDSIRPKTRKPAGEYLVGFERTAEPGSQALYERMFRFMKERRLGVAGNSYEKFLLDEISAKDTDSYLLQVSIQVEAL